MSKMPYIDSKNKEHGFWGTVQISYNFTDDETKKVWDAMFNCIRDNNKLTNFQIRRLLDSARGRHLADQIMFYCKRDVANISKVVDTVKYIWENYKFENLRGNKE